MQALADRFILKAEHIGFVLDFRNPTSTMNWWNTWTHEARHAKNRSILFQFNVSADPLSANGPKITQHVQSSISGIHESIKYITIEEFERIDPKALAALHQQITDSRTAHRAAKKALQVAIGAEGVKINDLINKLI